jgi:hypothetical protein
MPNNIFFKKNLLEPQWQPSIEKCREIGNHPKFFKTKTGYKSNMKYNLKNHLSIYFATH